jgi:Nif-specific regulatory protein
MEPFLIAVGGPLKGSNFVLAKETIRIGRGPTNDLNIPDEHVSQLHATLTSEADGLYIADEQSANGTFLNGRRVSRAALSHGACIEVGTSLFKLMCDAPAIQFDEVDFAAASEELIEMPAAEGLYPLRLSPDDSAMERTTRDLQVLLQISQQMKSLHTSEEIQDALLTAVFEVVPAEKGAVLLVGETQDRFAGKFFKHRDGRGDDVRISKSVCSRVLSMGRAELMNNVHADADASASLLESGVASVICAPLTTGSKTIGIIHVDTTVASVQLDQKHLQILISLAGIGALALEHARYVEWLEAENGLLASNPHVITGMIGHTAEMDAVHRSIGRYAPSTAPVLIEGETGTGKELVAKALHRNSRRSDGPFVVINCAVLLKERAESELFGHERGAFTDARSRHEGCFERAQGGTLFFDEIGDLALNVQTMLLRALQEKTLRRMGGKESIPLDVRVVAATNRDLEQMLNLGTFRADLYERLCVTHITMPPLRERREDIPALAYHFLRMYSLREGREIVGLTPDALRKLEEYAWPRNIRELENKMWRAVLDAKSDRIDKDDLHLPMPPETTEAGDPTDGKLETAILEAKKRAVRNALQGSKGNVGGAARTLGIAPNSLSRLTRELGLKADPAS